MNRTIAVLAVLAIALLSAGCYWAPAGYPVQSDADVVVMPEGTCIFPGPYYYDGYRYPARPGVVVAPPAGRIRVLIP